MSRSLKFNILFVLVIAASAFLFTANLGKISLWNNNEPRYAHTARNMLILHNWITPIYKGKLRADKPVLTYWLIIISAVLLNRGKINEFVARISFALSAILCIAVTILFAKELEDETAGILSGIFLLFTVEFFETARRCLPDAPLCLFITLAFFFFYKGFKTSRKKFHLGCYAASALGFLTKGPVAVVIPLGTIIIFLALVGRLDELKQMKPLQGLLLFSAIALPWYIAVGPEFCREFFLLHNLKHALKGLDHVKPWYFYIEAAPVSYAPSAFFVPAAVCLQKREGKASSLLLPLTWATFTFTIFSLAAAKRVIYLLPLAPALAMTAGITTAKGLKNSEPLKKLIWLGVHLSFILMGLAVFAPILFRIPCPKAFYLLFPVPIAAAYLAAKRKSLISALILLFAMAFIAYSLYVLWFLPVYDRLHRSAKPLARKIKEIADDQPLYRLGSFDAALEYYLGRLYIPKVEGPKDLERLLQKPPSKKFFIITRERNWKKLPPVVKSKLSIALKMRNRDKLFLLLRSKQS